MSKPCVLSVCLLALTIQLLVIVLEYRNIRNFSVPEARLSFFVYSQ